MSTTHASEALTVIPEVSQEDRTCICQHLYQYNIQRTAGLLLKPDISINLALKDAEGQAMGGILCEVFLYCLYIDVLWIDERYRGSGYGRILIETAERIAKEHGCTFAHTCTFSYQAPDFYQRGGYKIFATIEDYPDGIKQYFLKKQL